MTKTEMAIEAYRQGDYKKSLRIAKGFRIKVSPEESSAMSLAYECMLYPDFYSEVGRRVEDTVEKGKQVLEDVLQRMVPQRKTQATNGSVQ